MGCKLALDDFGHGLSCNVRCVPYIPDPVQARRPPRSTETIQEWLGHALACSFTLNVYGGQSKWAGTWKPRRWLNPTTFYGETQRSKRAPNQLPLGCRMRTFRYFKWSFITQRSRPIHHQAATLRRGSRTRPVVGIWKVVCITEQSRLWFSTAEKILTLRRLRKRRIRSAA